MIALIGAAASGFMTSLAIKYARARDMIDRPNERSSHVRPTPRGGGIAIVSTFVAGTTVLMMLGVIPLRVGVALLGGILVAGIGWMDDTRGISVRNRVIVHLAAASWGMWWLGGLDSLWFMEQVNLGVAGSVLAVIGIVWCINLYNFMDGIDGLAAGQAVTVALFATIFLLLNGDRGLASLTALLAGASLGFLVWNWSPARIFMGDVGSGFLGYVFAILALAGEKDQVLPLVFWVVLSGAFVFDATLTLVRRMYWRDPVWNAHRLHAYQRMVGLVSGHAQVTRRVLLLNAGLAALVYLALLYPKWIAAVIIGALALLIAAYMWVEHRAPMAAQRQVVDRSVRR